MLCRRKSARNVATIPTLDVNSGKQTTHNFWKISSYKSLLRVAQKPFGNLLCLKNIWSIHKSAVIGGNSKYCPPGHLILSPYVNNIHW